MKRTRLVSPEALLGATLIVQVAHVVEHVAQVTQKFVLGREQAHGLLGAIFDVEWVHLAYNASLETALVATLALIKRAKVSPVPRTLAIVVGVQGYHVVEHLVKMFQHVALGVAAPPGLLGMAVPTIWLHFWVNVVVLGLMTLAYGAMACKEPRGIATRFRLRPRPAPAPGRETA
jgi:hypothetical protein